MAHNRRKKQILWLAAERRKQNEAGKISEEGSNTRIEPAAGYQAGITHIPRWESDAEAELTSDEGDTAEEEEEEEVQVQLIVGKLKPIFTEITVHEC